MVFNPFCTRCIRPGAIPFLFPPGATAAQLVQQLEANGWRGQIVGPHGSGKSSLLAALLPLLRQRREPVVVVQLHGGQSTIPSHRLRGETWTPSSLLVVDGYEQLHFLSRVRLGLFCRRRRIGLVVTSHHSAGLPHLFRTVPTLDLARAIVQRLLATSGEPFDHAEPVLQATGTEPSAPFDSVDASSWRLRPEAVISDGEVVDRFLRHGANLREMLLDLYDLFEQRRGELRR